jgi:hypothetical protein
MAIVDRRELSQEAYREALFVPVVVHLGTAREEGLRSLAKEWPYLRLGRVCEAELERRDALERD